ncbi:protein ADP-ribosyltransferase PARP3-like [Henckelia pumila]|uniref:protein ADP-ribosyltransferase PARP3-like n=1 Tax=Henckelia pumila TaxID=405737 RepID=UPI003C6E8B0F
MVLHQWQSHRNSRSDDEERNARKQKAKGKAPVTEKSPKKSRTEDENGQDNGESAKDIKAKFKKFCETVTEHLSMKQMREILEANDHDSGGSDDAVVPRCQDIMFYGPLEKCPICSGILEVTDTSCTCKGSYSEWSSCTYTTLFPPRRDPLKLPDSIKDSAVADILRRLKDSEDRPLRKLACTDKPFKGMAIFLSDRLCRPHQYWKPRIENHGGKVTSSIIGASCMVASPVERDRRNLAEAMERGIPVVGECWLSYSIEKREAQPLDAYDVLSNLVLAGRDVLLDKQDVKERALETITAQLKVYGKRGVHKDTKLQDGGKILEKDGILYNCVFASCDLVRGLNEYCIMQLIVVPENGLYMYLKRGDICDNSSVEEHLDELENVNDATKEFAKHFEQLTGNEFESWGREKKIHKKLHKLFPIDMDDGVEVRHGALGLRQLRVVAISKLEPKVANLLKVLCSQDIYRYALTEIGRDVTELPLGMVTDIHLNECETELLQFVEKLKCHKEKGMEREALWADFSQRMFTLMPSTKPYNFQEPNDIADHAVSAFETLRDINAASRLIGDMSSSTLGDPLFDFYKKLGCSISPIEKEMEDHKMIAQYLGRTYEPVKVGEISFGVSIENIFAVELSACPSLEDINKLPNKVLLWCGTRSSNLLRHLHGGFVPAQCFLPVPGYMFGKAIVCTDAAAEAARYGFTAVDRLHGFLVLAVASLGEHITELTGSPEDTTSLERKKLGVIGRGQKRTDESEHFFWKDDIKVPCGRLIPSEHKDSPLEYNEYAVYDPQQVSIQFLVAVKFEEQNVGHDMGKVCESNFCRRVLLTGSFRMKGFIWANYGTSLLSFYCEVIADRLWPLDVCIFVKLPLYS